MLKRDRGGGKTQIYRGNLQIVIRKVFYGFPRSHADGFPIGLAQLVLHISVTDDNDPIGLFQSGFGWRENGNASMEFSNEVRQLLLQVDVVVKLFAIKGLTEFT